MHNSNLIYQPIGIVISNYKYRYETPRQGVLAKDTNAIIELYPGNNFEQAVLGLEGFDRIWVIYDFHLNKNWKPMVIPPRHTNRKKVGVFATRAPYRPNRIGLSCVKLIKIEKLKIYISECDILDESPVLDIKPYLPYSDSFPDAKTGWVKDITNNIYQVIIEKIAQLKIDWLKKQAKINLDNFVNVQLSQFPDDISRKRIKHLDDNLFELSYRTWRIIYKIEHDKNIVFIIDIKSSYSIGELSDNDDKYQDKNLHKDFNLYFTKF